jgi:acyl-CoA dehydrogenase
MIKMDFHLTEEQKKLQQKARDFALNEILPVINYFDENDTMPVFLIKKANEAGLRSLEVPVKWGGHGLGLLENAIVTEEIAAACAGMSTSIFGTSLGTEPLLLCNNEAAKEKYFPIITKEGKIVSFATSEQTMGSDVGSMRCTAIPDGDDFRLNGTKYWITNAGYADYCSVFATIDPKTPYKGIGCFFVDMKKEGVKTGEHIPKMGQRTSNTTAIKFDNYRVKAEDVLALPGDGFGLAMNTFTHTRPIIGSFAVGAARSCLDFSIEYVKKRKAFGQRLSDFQNTQFKLAEMYQKVFTSRLMVYYSAWEIDNGMDGLTSASMTKFYASEAAYEVGTQALQFMAGYGYTKLYPLEKILRDLALLKIYEGTSEVQRMIVSRYALGGYKTIMPAMDDMVILKADNVEEAAREGMKAQTVWRCRICGYTHYGEIPPEECPVCLFPKTAFKNVWPK